MSRKRSSGPGELPPAPLPPHTGSPLSDFHIDFLLALKQKIFNNPMTRKLPRQERSDDRKLPSSVWWRCQTSEGGPVLLLLLLSWRGVLSEVRGGTRRQRPKAEKDPYIYLMRREKT